MDRTLLQEIPLHLQLADLLVQPGDQGGIVPGLLLLAVAENPGGALRKSLLPSLNLTGMDLVPGGQLSHRLLALQRLQSLPLRRQGAALALKAGLWFLRPCDISCSFPTATAALSLGAELSLRYLSEIPGPPHPGAEAHHRQELPRRARCGCYLQRVSGEIWGDRAEVLGRRGEPTRRGDGPLLSEGGAHGGHPLHLGRRWADRTEFLKQSPGG